MFNIGPQCKEMNAQGVERVEKGTLSMVGVLEGEVTGGGGPGTLQEDNCGWDCRWIEMKKSLSTCVLLFFHSKCARSPLQVISQDGGVLSVGADIQFRIWNPVMSVLSVQDLNASTRMAAQNALTQSLAKKTVREIQSERVKLGEYLGVR